MGFSLVIKPASSDCNLRCRYCYYRRGRKPSPEEQARPPRMSDGVLDQLICMYMQTDQDVFSFVWHGGEPSLMPVSFFEKAVSLQKRHAVKGSRISNSLQTNGTLISAELSRFLGQYRFLCGVSLDGPPKIHNRYRLTATGAPTHEKTLQGISMLASHGVAVNILVLVTSANVDKPLSVYRYLRKKGFAHIQFIPCVEFDRKGKPLPFSITPEQWGGFLASVFDEWYAKDIRRVSIRQFESVLATLVHNVSIDCYSSGACNRYLVVEHNGDIYPCDFFVRQGYTLGNILEDSFETIVSSSFYQHFSECKSRLPEDCRSCSYLSLCMGDCLKFRKQASMGAEGLSLLCRGWKKFYRHTLGRFENLAARL